MQGRIIALRVSDADFELLDGLKRKEGIGWNQLLLVPVEAAYSVTIETARPKEKPAKEEKPAKASKKKSGKEKAAEAEAAPAVVAVDETETEG